MAIKATDFINLGSQEVEVPGFPGSDKTITFRLKKVSAMGLMVSGKIPNALMSTVLNVFKGKSKEEVEELRDNPEDILQEDEIGKIDFSEMAMLIDTVCSSSMIEPKYEEVKDYMTDEQKQFIFGWAYEGKQGEKLSTFPTE